MENGETPISAINDYPYDKHIGLTKREYFAGLAMQGLLVNHFKNGFYGSHPSNPLVSEIAVRVADDLLEELSKENL